MYIRKQRGATHPRQEEYVEAVKLAGYLLKLQREGKISVYSHIPHETYTTSWNQKRKNKRQGVRAGVPDYIIVINEWVVFLELKKQRGGVVSKDQKQWLEELNNKSTLSTVCNGYEQSKDFIEALLTGTLL